MDLVLCSTLGRGNGKKVLLDEYSLHCRHNWVESTSSSEKWVDVVEWSASVQMRATKYCLSFAGSPSLVVTSTSPNMVEYFSEERERRLVDSEVVTAAED